MNFDLKYLPVRDHKPRQNGLTMVMDKGMSVREAENLLSVAGTHIDIIKLGWGTSCVTNNLEAKLEFYRSTGMPFYFGGTLFEAFVIRNQFDDYRRILDKYNLQYAEVSDGSMFLPHDEKCNYIHKLKKQVTVISEVGSKDEEVDIPVNKWVEYMKAELDAGAWKVIAEAREGGNVGMFSKKGDVKSGMVETILANIPQEKIIWEAPLKAQQIWFVKLLGANVNLGNIAPAEVIPLETVRLGLRGDTFHHFLADMMK